MPVLAPREPIVVAVVRNAAVIGWTRDDEVHTPVWQWKCARIAVPHLHATVVVNRLTRCINAQAIRRFSSSSDIDHDRGIPLESAMVRTASSRGRPSAVSHREIQRCHTPLLPESEGASTFGGNCWGAVEVTIRCDDWRTESRPRRRSRGCHHRRGRSRGELRDVRLASKQLTL